MQHAGCPRRSRRPRPGGCAPPRRALLAALPLPSCGRPCRRSAWPGGPVSRGAPPCRGPARAATR
eukprot:315794-Lingulodinium_polyedra.AAC.1